ncbi:MULTISPECIES: class I SAM-dependent methyltransferase [unclassified Kitasatospora]|uniref:class I SAM-dependent methyltransferase n=1 Tax=unclassified Kitasatospora TaxID=2633591 RepID=UPI000710A9A3|nr:MULTISPECIES: class I SAM-dependent methyltransferase [unclassified Kitasatospora]KQV12514.1 chromosome partitioning protein ParB [Kitasatospora sp. Root107]KRB73626.1 chromosome partitioning protein ParB [Kitasatospora sp. Root187]
MTTRTMPTDRYGPAPGITPFSVLRSDMGPWTNRRRMWRELGVGGTEGREQLDTHGLGDNFGGKGFTAAPSTFDPVLAEASYHWFCPPAGRILDPFAGGAVRGLVAGNGGYRYTGVDLNPGQVAVNRDLADDWHARQLLTAHPHWVVGDARDALAGVPDGSADYVFTCPPYHSLERYSQDPADLSNMSWDAFTEAYSEVIRESVRCLANDRFTTWVVGEVRGSTGRLRGLAPLTIAAHEAAGARLYNDAILLN